MEVIFLMLMGSKLPESLAVPYFKIALNYDRCPTMCNFIQKQISQKKIASAAVLGTGYLKLFHCLTN